MKDVSKFSAAEILATSSPESLFTGDVEIAEQEYRKLSQLWHPDRNPTADGVFAQVNVLYHQALDKLKAGTWHTPGLFIIKDLSGKKFQVRYLKHHPFELGDLFIGQHLITYLIHKDAADLFQNAKRAIKSFKYANAKMESEMSRYLPQIHAENETEDYHVLVIKKTPDLILLRDLLAHQKGKVDPKHVAWIMSRLYNLACYLKHAGITHNSIGLDSFYVSPQHHSGALLGGWWYSTPANSKLIAVPTRTMTYAPHGLTSKKVADFHIDSELIRATGRELLGDGGGSKLLTDPKIPNALLNWLRVAGTGDAFREYEDWYKVVLKDSFGEHRFVELKVNSSDVYKEII